MRIFKDFGFWREEPLKVGSCDVVPKEVFCAVFGPKLEQFKDRDQCAVRGVGIGVKDGRPTAIQIDIFDYEDEATGFTSMERLTGFSTSIIAQEVAQGKVERGAVRYENAMTGTAFLRELVKRGIDVKIKMTHEMTPTGM
jgi:lysine 6-dehydrogenase